MQRVPGGIEAESHVTKEQELELLAWARRSSQPGRSSSGAWHDAQVAAADALLRPPAPTVRVVRADFFSTKGQGFLYVEARTTKGAQTTPGRGDDARERHGRGHGVRVTAHDEPLRGLGRVHVPPQPVQGGHEHPAEPDPRHVDDRERTDGQTIGTVSKWLDDVTPLTADPNYKSDFVNDYKTPQQLYGRFEQLARRTRRSPRSWRCRTRPTATSARRRPRSAGTGAVRGGRELRRLGA